MVISASDGHSEFSIRRSWSIEVLWVPVIPDETNKQVMKLNIIQ